MSKKISNSPRRWCAYDQCHSFEPESWNAAYCNDCKCKRRMENSRKRLNTPLVGVGPGDWEVQESKKQGRLKQAVNKNAWLIGFFDIESTNLDASIGMMLCACVKERGGSIETFACDISQLPFDDHKMVVAIRNCLESYDYVVTWYGQKFDIPFLNTRLLMHGERPLERLRHIDLYYTARFKMKLHSNRLGVVAETLFGSSDKSRVLGPEWIKAMMGEQESLDYIIKHCQIDVAELEKVFDSLRGFVNLSATRWRVFGGSY